MGHQVRRATTVDVPSLAAVLAASFLDDPLWRFILPGAGRDQRLRQLFGLLVAHAYLPDDTVWCEAGRRSVAVWAPPDGWRAAGARLAPHLEVLTALYGERVDLVLRFLRVVEDHHPEERHWYLPLLATEPAAQGRGLGSAVLAPVLERCDAEGVPAYLEASSVANLGFYLGHGFNVAEELRPLPEGPMLWPMWRPPRAQGAGTVSPPRPRPRSRPGPPGGARPPPPPSAPGGAHRTLPRRPRSWSGSR